MKKHSTKDIHPFFGRKENIVTGLKYVENLAGLGLRRILIEETDKMMDDFAELYYKATKTPESLEDFIEILKIPKLQLYNEVEKYSDSEKENADNDLKKHYTTLSKQYIKHSKDTYREQGIDFAESMQANATRCRSFVEKECKALFEQKTKTPNVRFSDDTNAQLPQPMTGTLAQKATQQDTQR